MARWRTRKTSASSPCCAIHARGAAELPRRSSTTAWSTTISCWRRWRRAAARSAGPGAGARIPGGQGSGRHHAWQRAGAQSLLGGRACGGVCEGAACHQPGRHQGRTHDRKLARQRTGTGSRTIRVRRERRIGARGPGRRRAARRRRTARRHTQRQPATNAGAGRPARTSLGSARLVVLRGGHSRRAARADITAYAQEIGVDGERALRAMGEQPLAFHALSLDEQGRPVPILNSDEGFRLLLTEPAVQWSSNAVSRRSCGRFRQDW